MAGVSADVPVSPDTTGFRAQLIAAVKKASAGVNADVPAGPDTTGFRAKLIAAVKKAAAGTSANVPVSPDAAGFRAKLIAAVKAATAGVDASVPVGTDLTGSGLLRAKIEAALAGLHPDVPVTLDAESAAAVAAKIEAELAALHLDIPVGIDLNDAAEAIAALRTLMRSLGLADFLDIDVAPGRIISQLQLLKRKMNQAGIADLLEVNLNQSQMDQQLAKLSHVTEEIPVELDVSKLPGKLGVEADVTNAAQDAADALLLAATRVLTEATIALNVTTAPLIPATYLLIGATDALTKATIALTAATRAEKGGGPAAAAAAEPGAAGEPGVLPAEEKIPVDWDVPPLRPLADAAARGIKETIPVDFDVSRMPAEALAPLGEKVDITASTAQALGAVTALQAKLAMLSEKLTDLRIGANDTAALATIAALQAKAAALTEAVRKIIFAADTSKLDAAIAAETAKITVLQQKMRDLQVNADTAAATAKIAALEKQIAGLYAGLEKIEETGVDLDINAALTKIYALEAQLAVLNSDARMIKLSAQTAVFNAQIAASAASIEALKAEAADVVLGGGVNSTALAKAEAQVLALDAAVTRLAPAESDAATAAAAAAAALTAAGGSAGVLTGKLIPLDVELAAKSAALKSAGVSAVAAGLALRSFTSGATGAAGAAKAAASADDDATTSLLGAAVGAQRAGMEMAGLIGAFRDTAGIAGWGGIIHSVFMLTMEYLAVAIPGTVALGAAVAVQLQAWGDMYERMSAIYTVSEALGGSFHDTAGQMLGLTNTLQNAQNVFQTKTYELLGAAINAVKQDMSNANGVGHLFIGMGEQVTVVLDQFAAKIDVDLSSGMGQFTGLLSKGVADLTEFGQILGNVGHAILDFASDMPGLAEVILKVIDGITGLLLWISKLPPMLITVVMAIEEAYRWSGYLAAVFGLVGKGIELLGTLGLPIIAKIGSNISLMFASIIRGASGAILNLGMIGEKLPVIGESVASGAKSMAAGLEGVAAFLAGPWGIAIGLAVGALVVLGVWLSNTKTETQQWVDGLESAIKSAAGLAQIGSTVQDLGAVTAALGKAQDQVTTGQTKMTASSAQVSKALDAVNKSGSGNLQTFSQYLKSVQASSQAQDQWGASVSAAAAKVPTLTAAQKQLNTDFGTEKANVLQLASTYKISYVEAAILAGQAGANLTQSMKGNSTAAQENLQMVKNYIAGLGGMGAVQGQLGADVNAVTIDAALQATMVSKLTTAWTDVMNMVQAPSSSFLSLAQSLVQYNADAGAAGATTTGLGGAVAATAKKVSTASIQLQQDFNAAASAAQTMLNSLYVTSTVTGSNGLLIQGIKDTIAVLLPLAGSNKAAAAQIQVLAQEANLGGKTLPQLAKAVGGTKDPLTDLYKISGEAATQLSNLGKDASNLASTIQSSLNQTLVAAAEQLTGVSAKTSIYLQDLQNLGAGSPVTQAALDNLNGAVAQANVLSSQAAGGISALTGKVTAEGTGTAAQQANRQTLLTDITNIISKAPGAGSAIQNLITKIQQQGSTTASQHGDRQTLINDLVAMKVPLSVATNMVDNLIGAIKKIPASTAFTLTETGTGSFSIRDISSTGNVGGIGGHTSPTAAAGMLVTQGTGPTADDVLIRVSRGETVVSAADSKKLAGAFKALGIPGYAAGGAIGSAAALAPETTNWHTTFDNSMTIAMEAAMTSALKAAEASAKAAAAAAAASTGGKGGISSSGVSNSSAEAALESAAAKMGWTGAEWTALYDVEMREAGFSLTAQNPSSGAYGMAQFINGPSEYAQYGGNSTTAAGQATAMVNYIACMPLDGRILTRDGWKTYSQVKAGDETVGYDHATGSSAWTKVTAVHYYENGPVVRLFSNRVNLRSTPNHRWLTEKNIQTGKSTYRREEFTETQHIGSRHRIRLAAPHDDPAGLPISLTEAELLGWIAGDGHVSYPTANSVNASVFQSEAKPKQLASLRVLLESTPHSEYTRPAVGGRAPIHQFRLRSPYVRQLFDRSCYEGDLELMVLSMSAGQRAGFMAGLLEADGYMRNGTWTFCQNEGPVLRAFMLAAYLAGYWCNATDSAGQKHVTLHTAYVGSGSGFHREDLGLQPVWCVTTGLGSWTVEQGGQVFLTGNSRYGTPEAAWAHEEAYGWYGSGGLIPGYAKGGLIPGFATGAIVPPGKAMDAAQTKELADYAAAVRAVRAALARPAKGSWLAAGTHAASVQRELGELITNQNYETSSFNSLKTKGLTSSNLSYFKGQAAELLQTAQDADITHADSGITALAGILKTLEVFSDSTSAASKGSSAAAKTSKDKTSAETGAQYLKGWKTSSGTVNNQISQTAKQLAKDTTLAGAKGLSKSLHAKYAKAEASDKAKLAKLNTELGVMRDWRTSLSSSDSSLSSWISAAGDTKVLAKNVTAWKKQLASQKATIAKISFMLGPTAASLAAAAAAATAAAATASSAAGSTASSGLSSAAGSSASSSGTSTASSAPGVTISPEQALQLLNLASSVGGAPSGMMPGSGLPAAVPGAAAWFDNGGVITEPIMGRGMRSGQLYGFGGHGPETVTPGIQKRSGASLDDVTSLLRELVTATKQAPAQTGRNFGRALNDTARQAGMSGQYTTRRMPL
jgi:hypothetical protein